MTTRSKFHPTTDMTSIAITPADMCHIRAPLPALCVAFEAHLSTAAVARTPCHPKAEDVGRPGREAPCRDSEVGSGGQEAGGAED